MDEELRKLLRQVSRKEMYDLWERAKEGDFEGLTDEEERIAKIMLDHQDEFYNHCRFNL
jgi:hypothetical protein